MIRVFIAEDQQLILKDLCRKLERYGHGVALDGTALDGETACRLILERRPDIVFTDVRMPVVNGIDLIRRVREQGLDTVFVIISGYRDFEYAREAIKLGVNEYLLKPVSQEDISQVLDDICPSIVSERNSREENTLHNILISTSRSHLTGSACFCYKCYYLMHLTAGPFSVFPIDYATPFGAFFDALDLRCFQGRLAPEEKLYLFSCKNSNERILLYCAMGEDGQAPLKEVACGLTAQAQCAGIPLTIAVSRCVHHPENLGIESQIIRTISRNNLVFAVSKLVFCEQVQLHLCSSRIFLGPDMEIRMRFALQNKNRDALGAEVKRLLTALEESGATQLELEKSLKSMAGIHLAQSVRPEQDTNLELEIDECISNSRSYRELSDALAFVLDEITAGTDRPGAADTQRMAKDAMQYLDSHFADDVSIGDLAERFFITPAYFSRAFKRYAGVPPIEYLTRARITRAQEYFRQSSAAIREVAEACGYSDPLYFSKAFKTVTGMSPTEYRARFRETHIQ